MIKHTLPTDEQIVFGLFRFAREQMVDAVRAMTRQELKPATFDDLADCKTPGHRLLFYCGDVEMPSLWQWAKIDAFTHRCIDRIDGYLTDHIQGVYVVAARARNRKPVDGIESNIRQIIATEFQRQVA